MKSLLIPEEYAAQLNKTKTMKAVNFINQYFEEELSNKFNLLKIDSPLFAKISDGFNADAEKENYFNAEDMIEKEKKCAVFSSPVKWMRYAVKNYDVKLDEGIFIDFTGIKPDVQTDNINSIKIKTWEIERFIDKKDRTEEYLFNFANNIYDLICSASYIIKDKFNVETFNDELKFISSMELEEMWPDETPAQREYNAANKYGAVFIYAIGGMLFSGQPHENILPDFEDWDLNGKLLIYYDLIDTAIPIASVSVRVDSSTLNRQLIIRGAQQRSTGLYHHAVLHNELPQTIGCTINKSLLYIYLLQKAHIGEVMVSAWPADSIEICRGNNIFLLK